MVSIIVPLFNRQELIKETLASIRKQTFQNWECIVVDDGSTDDSVDTVEKLSSSDSRIKLFIRPFTSLKGAASCRNIGLKKATKKYVVFLDSDDLLHSTALQNRINILEEGVELDFLTTKYRKFYLLEGQRQFLKKTIVRFNDPLLCFLKKNIIWLNGSVTWRKEYLLKAHGLWDEKLLSWQDFEYHMRALLLSENYKQADDEDVFIRVASNDNIGISSTSSRHLNNHISLLDSLLNNDKIKSNPYYRSAIGDIYLWLAIEFARQKAFIKSEDMFRACIQAKSGESFFTRSQDLLLYYSTKHLKSDFIFRFFRRIFPNSIKYYWLD